MGKVANSRLPYRGSPPLQSGGQNQKWPTSGQSGRIGDPHRFRAGGNIRSGPQVGKVATSPLPYRGSPPMQSGGQNQKWPTSGQNGYLTPTILGIPTVAQRGAKSEVAHNWAKCLPHACRIGDPHRLGAGGKIRSGPQVGKVATSPLLYRGSPPLQTGGQNQKWPTSGQSGYLTRAVSGIPTASERGAKSEVAHKWAKWLPHPCRMGDPHRCRAGSKIRSGPQKGKVATSPLPYWGSPPLHSSGQNQKWPTSGQSGYLTPAVSGIPTAADRGAKSEVAHNWAKWLPHPCCIGDPTAAERGAKSEVAHKWAKSLPHPCRIGDPHRFRAGGNSEVAHKWAKWLPQPCRIGDPHRCRAGGKIRSGPQVGKVATSPLPYRGSPPLQSGWQNQKWPTSGQSGYLTPAISGIPTATERGAKLEVAHKWAKWLPHPCRIEDPHRCRAWGKIRSGPQVGKLATSPLPYRVSSPLQSGGQNQKWPTSGQSGYLTPAVSGIPTASERGAKSEVAHKWAKWLPHPCRIGDPHRFRAGGKIRSGPQVGKVAVSGIPTAAERGATTEVAHKWAKWLPHPCHIGDPHRCRAGGRIRSGPQVGKVANSPLPYRGSPPLHSGGQNQKWPTTGQNAYLTPAVSGIPTASERGAKTEVAHKWAKWLPHPSRVGDPHRFTAGGKMATSPLPYRGSPPLQSGGQNQKWPTSGQSGYLTLAVSGIPTASERGAKSEVAHKWAKWLPQPCRIGDPHRFRAEGKIRSGPQVGKVATSPLPYRGCPPLQSGEQNQKWPTSGQSGYLTPPVSGIPTAWERGAKSEVAHKCAKWLPHPCCIGDPHRCRPGGKIRSGPQVGKMATSPLPYRGSPPLGSGGQNQNWPTSGQSRYLTPAVLGIPTAAERGAKSGVAHKWAKWLPQPCRTGIPTAAERGAKSEVAHKWAKWLPHACRIGDPHRCRAGGKIRSGPQVGKVATSPLPYRGSPPLQSGGQNQKWPTSGQNGYLTPAVSGIRTASERGAKSEVAHKWAKWLPHPCRIGYPHRFREGAKSEVAHKWAKWLPHPCRIGYPQRCRAGGKIRSGQHVGKMATSPLPYRGSPPLQSGGQNQKWPTSGQSGYLTPAVSGIPTASEREQNQRWPTSGQSGYLTPAVLGIPSDAERGAKSEVANTWAKWLPHPCRIGDPHRFRAGSKIRCGPQVGKVANSTVPYRGSSPLQSGGQNQKWPTSGQSGYLTPAVSGIPTAAERGGKSEVAHKWAKWLPHPCRIGYPQRCRAGGKIRSGQHVGKMATSPLPYRGSPPLQSGEQNQMWPTSGQSGYLTLAVSGIPTAVERWAKSEVAQKWAKWLPHPCRIGDPHRRREGGKIRSGPQVGKLATSPLPYRGKVRSGPQVGKVATSPLPYRGSPPLQSGRQNQKWPTSGQNGYLTPAVSGIPTAAERGAKSEVAHKWAKWLPHPCRIGDPHRFEEGGKIKNRPQVGKMATSPLPYRGKKSEVAHKWAKWLPQPRRIGDPHRCRAGGKIRSGPHVGKMATSPLPYRGSPPLQSGGQNQMWPTSGQNGYLTPAVSGIPTAAKRGAKSEVAHKWAKWLPHPCRIGDPHRCREGGKIRSGPQVGKVATSPLPYRGSPPLQSGGQNQKWPTSGQNGYLTPAVSGMLIAAERGSKSEVAHKWAKWLPQPGRIGDPHRFRAGGKIRSGPQVGKVATSPLPYRGSPPLRRGGQNQKWPTSGQSGYLTPAVSGIPTAAERGAKSEVAHKWAKWLPHPCRIGDPHRCRAGGKIRSGPQVGKMATSPLPYRGSPPLQSGGQNQKWPTSGQSGYLTPAVSGIPTASERGAKIRSGPQVGKVATSPLPYRGSPPLHSGEKNQKWPTSGQNGYLTPAVSGIATATERRAKSEVAHKWAKWLLHPCRIGDPHRCRAGGKIRSGPQVGKVATSPVPYRGSPPLQSGGQNQKWPTSGQSGYLTPAVLGSPPLRSRGENQKWPTSGQSGYLTPTILGIPTVAERGAKSEVAPKWAKWLTHPCRIGDPHRFRAGGNIGSGPHVGKMATSPLPYRGSPPLQSGGQNQMWPTSGQNGYLTRAISGIPTAAERGAKSEVAHKWAKWLPHPCRIEDPHRCRAGGKIRSGPQVGKLATSPLPYRGSPPLQSGGQNQKWPTRGQNGYLTPAVSGIPTASKRGGKSEVAHKWAKWLPHPYHIGDPHRCRAGGKIRSGPQVGKVANSPLPYRGSPPLQSEGQHWKWPTRGQNGYLTPAVSGIPTASERGAKSDVAHKWAKWLPHPCHIGDPHRCREGGKIRSGPQVGKVATSPLPYRGSPPLQSGGQNQMWPTSGQNGYLTRAISGIPTAAERGAKSEVAQEWAKWLPHPCRIEDPHRCRAGGKIRSGPQVGKLATSPLPYRGSPPLQSGGQNQKWPTRGQNGYLTPAVSGIPTASKRGGKSEVAHKWAKWLPHPYHIGDPHRCRAGGKIRSGPQVGKVANSPLPYRGSPPLQSEGQHWKWPTRGQNGYLTPTVSGIPTASERGAKSDVAHKWAKWLPHPCHIGDPHRCREGGKIRSGPQVGKVATSPLPYRGSPPLQSGGQNQKWPTSGQIGYLTPAVSGIPTAAERGAKSEVAHTWAKWLPHPCRIGDPHRFGAGVKIRSGPQVGKVATSPLPYRGSPPLQSGGQIEKWPTSGQNGYLTLAVSGIPTASERGTKSEVAHKWAKWLPHPCRIGDPHRFRAGGKIRSGPQVGKVATSPLPYRGSPPLHSGEKNQKWPTSGQNGYLTPAVSGIPTAVERGAKSEVAHKWAKWLPHPCRIGVPTAAERGGKSEVAHKWAKWLPHPYHIGDPHRCRAGGKIRSGPQVGKVATSPLPYRGSPPLQSGGQHWKWPTRGQNGYLTPAVSGIPTASERGAKSDVAHKWAKWLPHPCHIGDPHRCREGGKIRSGPQVGKVATSPFPYRGSPPLQSGGQNQKWPTSGQIGYLTPAISGILTATERGSKSEVAHKWAKWLPHPCRIRDPHRFRAGGKIRSGPQVGKLATSPLPYRVSSPLQSGGQNQKWPTSGQNGYLTPAVSGIPAAAERGAKSEVAHKWAKWLPHPCRIGDPHRCRAGGKIRSGPQVGKVATSPLPYGGSPPLQSGGQNQKWPTSGQSGYLTPAVSGIPTASERGSTLEVAHKWAKWLPHPCRIGDPHRFRAGGKIRCGPQVGKMATSPVPYRGSPPLQRGGQNQKWPTSGQSGYLTLSVSRIPTAAERGAKSEVAHKWANWLPHPCHIGYPHRCRAGVKIRSGPQVGKMATSPLPHRGSPPLQSGGQNQKWPTSGQIGYLTPAVSGILTAAERGAKSEVAHKWAKWLPHPCRIGDPGRCRAGGKI